MILGNRVTTTRKIGSEAYVDYLNDILTCKYYDNQLPAEDDPVKEAQSGGQRLWRTDAEVDPWERLAAAVIAMVAKDYVRAVFGGRRMDWLRRECEQYFEENEFAWPVYEELRVLMRWAGDDKYRRRLVERHVRLH